MTHFCLHQVLTHRADKPFLWSVQKVESGQRPEPLRLHDESPPELTEWAKQLNVNSGDTAFDFGVIDIAAIVNAVCVIDGAAFTPIDSRGRWISATGFGTGATRPYGLGLPASWKHCPVLAALLDVFYGESSKPLPPAPPKPKAPPPPGEKLDKARDELRCLAGTAMGLAIETFINAKLAVAGAVGPPRI